MIYPIYPPKAFGTTAYIRKHGRFSKNYVRFDSFLCCHAKPREKIPPEAVGILRSKIPTDTRQKGGVLHGIFVQVMQQGRYDKPYRNRH